MKFFQRSGVGLGEFEKNLGVGNSGFEIFLLRERFFDAASLLDDFLSLFLVVPKRRLGDLFF